MSEKPVRVRFLGDPTSGVAAIEVNGRARPIAAVARYLRRLANHPGQGG